MLYLSNLAAQITKPILLMPNQPIPVETANEMIEEYINYMQEHGIDMEHQTHNVSFDFTTLQEWLGSISPYTDELKICLGVYTSGEHAGRITTILWPYKSGEPANNDEGEIEPFNDGAGTP